MKPLRLAHISDTHLGYRAVPQREHEGGRNQRSVDVEDAFHHAVSDILMRDVNLVIHSGDLFQQARPAYAAIRSAIREFRRLEAAGIEIIVIGGNHDTPRLRTSGSVFSVIELALEKTKFVTGYDDETILLPELETRVLAVPHGRLINPVPPAAQPTPGKRSILVSHGFIPGLTLPGLRHEPGEEEIGDELLDTGFDYIALGHYHVSSHPRPNTWYAGSTERYGWGDFDVTPGYLLVELGEPGEPAKVEHIPIPARPMVQLPVIAGSGLNATAIADEIMQQLESKGDPAAIVRVAVADINRMTRREAESILRKQAAHLAWWIDIGIYATTPLLVGDRSAAPASADLPTMFEQFIAQELQDQAMNAEFVKEFGSIGKAALETAMHDLVESETEGAIA